MQNLGTDGRVRRTTASCKCPMLKKRKQTNIKREIKEQDPLDIEDLVHLGTKLGACPYYGSRSMVPGADLVILPYQSLLSKSSRESLGLDLKNNIVIIDEAHNLADSLISMYDSRVTSYQVKKLDSYLHNYSIFLKASCRFSLAALLLFCFFSLFLCCLDTGEI